MVDIQPVLHDVCFQFTHGDGSPGKIYGGRGGAKTGDFYLDDGEYIMGVDIRKGYYRQYEVRNIPILLFVLASLRFHTE